MYNKTQMAMPASDVALCTANVSWEVEGRRAWGGGNPAKWTQWIQVARAPIVDTMSSNITWPCPATQTVCENDSWVNVTPVKNSRHVKLPLYILLPFCYPSTSFQTHTHTHTETHTTYTYKHIYIYTHADTHMHTHVHARTHTHTQREREEREKERESGLLCFHYPSTSLRMLSRLFSRRWSSPDDLSPW